MSMNFEISSSAAVAEVVHRILEARAIEAPLDVNPDTVTGVVLVPPIEPSPSWPAMLSPQHWTCPVNNAAQAADLVMRGEQSTALTKMTAREVVVTADSQPA